MDIRATSIAPAPPTATAYRRAMKHSSRVRRWKILLPIAAVIISLCFIAASWIHAMFPDNLSIGGAKIENGKVVMERPAISGRNDEGISYFMNARRALQDITNPNLISLEDIDAAVPIRGDLIARVKASAANFDRSTDILDMTAPFIVTLSSGVVVHFQSAHLDVHAGRMNSEEHVKVEAKDSTLVADKLAITDKGRVIAFSGHVKVVVNPAAYRNKENRGQKSP